MAETGTVARPYARAIFDLARADMTRADTARADRDRTEPARVDMGRADSDRAQPVRARPADTGAAHAGDALAAWSAALRDLAAAASHPEARAFLARRELDDEARVAFLVSICAAGDAGGLLASGRGRNLLRLLAENRRLEALPEISRRFDALKARAENTVRVRLVTAGSVEPTVVDRIGRALERNLGRAVEIELRQDPGLLGGAVIEAEGRVIDGSVRSRLAGLAATLAA